MSNNMLHLYIGNGKGKTCSAYGLALRALGNGFKVGIFSFLKSSDCGEIKLLKKLAESDSNLCVNISDKKHGFFYTLSQEEKNEVICETNSLFKDFEAILKEGTADLIILDEIIDALNLGIIDENKLISLLKEKKAELVLTGRNPSEKLIEIADYVSDINKISHPYDKGVPARKGIEY